MAAQLGSGLTRAGAVAAIGLGAWLVLAPGCGPPPVETDQQKTAASSDQRSDALGEQKSDVRDDQKSDASHDQRTDASEDQKSDASDDGSEIDLLGVNAACYVCHMTFVPEELSKVHLKEKVTCIECHGLSAGHANDEDIGATPPDVTYERHEVDASCEECHEEHDVPATKIIARSLERRLPDASPICTDCHGTHKIEQAEETATDSTGLNAVQPQPTSL